MMNLYKAVCLLMIGTSSAYKMDEVDGFSDENPKSEWSMPTNDEDGEPIDYDCDLILVNQALDGYKGGQCAFVTSHCGPQGPFNFNKMYFCGFQESFGQTGKIFAFLPVGVFFMFIGMYNLASTSDDYLSPALETMTTKFSLSDSLAGVTLLAFGNGAPDVFSAIAGAKDGNSDGVLTATKSVSVVVGGTFFISSVVMFFTCQAANLNEDKDGPPIRNIKVTPRFFIRDIMFYIITCVYMLVIMLGPGYFSIYTSIGLIVIYMLYIIVVLLQSKGGSDEEAIEEKEINAQAGQFHQMVSMQRHKSRRIDVEHVDMDKIAVKVERQMTKQRTQRMGNLLSPGNLNAKLAKGTTSVHVASVALDFGGEASNKHSVKGSNNNKEEHLLTGSSKNQINDVEIDSDEEDTIEVGDDTNIDLEAAPDRMFIVNKLRTMFKGAKDEGILDIFMRIIAFPLNLLRDYTVPIGEEDAWDRERAAVIPMTLVLAFFILNGNIAPGQEDKWTYFYIGLISFIPGGFIGVFIYLKTTKTEAPGFLITIFSVLCFLMSIMWVQFTSNVIMDLLQLIGFITQLPEALLALTIIAWGNCLGDMAANVAMTKKGFGEMAITGCIAGPIFNVLMGIGLSTLIGITSTSKPLEAQFLFGLYFTDQNGITQFDKLSVLPLTLLIGQLVVLILILINGISNSYHISYNQCKISMGFYFMTIIGLIAYSLIEKVQPPS